MTSSDGETNQGDTIQGGTLFSIPFVSYGENNQGGKPQTMDTQKNLTFDCKMSLISE